MEATEKELIEKFVKTSIWDIWRALEVAISELGIEDAVQGAYALDDQFMIIIKDQQDKARKYLLDHYPKIK